MTEVRDLSNNTVATGADGTIQHHHQYGLFATSSYSEGDVILTESPLVVLSSSSSADNYNDVKSQFKSSSLASSTKPAAAAGKSKKNSHDQQHDDDVKQQSTLSSLILPHIHKPLNSASLSKIRGMVLALASYAANPPSEETKRKLLHLHHPSDDDDDGDQSTKEAFELVRIALECGQKMAAPDGALSSIFQTTKDDDDDADDAASNLQIMSKILLIYSCNAFEGGRIYHQLSRVNHSCNPNAVVVEGDTEDSNKDVSVLKAACDIAPGDEINISYLGKYLFAGYPIRQRILRANKHFVCRCVRCNTDDGSCSKKGGDADGDAATKRKSDTDTSYSNSNDLACRIPCPICHPRSGRYLDEDVMFDDEDNAADDVGGLKVCYAIPTNGLTPEERSLYCPSCKETTAVLPESGGGGSTRKKKEGMAIKYMCKAEDKVYDRLEQSSGVAGGSSSSSGGGQTNDTKKKTSSSGGDNTETERDIDQQFLQMATSICGAQHWTTHFLNLSLIEESLASFHSTLMSMGQNPNKDAELMEEIFVEIAEAADGIERAYKFAASLELNLDPAHWLFDYTVGLARTLVGLGDVKSQKYAAEWVTKVEKYADKFEGDGMRKVVVALRDAWKREGGKEEEEKGEKKKSSNGSDEIQEGTEVCKRRKIG